MSAQVTVFWRPGCMFCASLFRQLARHEVTFERRDIWQDEEAAAQVRRATGGDETVPTVQVGDVFLVNPSVNDVLRAAHQVDPATDLPAPRPPGRLAGLIGRMLGAPPPTSGQR